MLIATKVQAKATEIKHKDDTLIEWTGEWTSSMCERIMHAENDLQNQLIKCGARKHTKSRLAHENALFFGGVKMGPAHRQYTRIHSTWWISSRYFVLRLKPPHTRYGTKWHIDFSYGIVLPARLSAVLRLNCGEWASASQLKIVWNSPCNRRVEERAGGKDTSGTYLSTPAHLCTNPLWNADPMRMGFKQPNTWTWILILGYLLEFDGWKCISNKLAISSFWICCVRACVCVCREIWYQNNKTQSKIYRREYCMS